METNSTTCLTRRMPFKIPGKIDYVKQGTIDIEISAGTMFDYKTWVPAVDHQTYFGNQVVPYYQHLGVEISVDGVVLLDQTVGTDTIKFQHVFLDSETDCDHTLKIAVKGLEPEFNHFYQDKDVFTMLKINNISIENLPLQYLLEQTGQYYHDGIVDSVSRYLGYKGHCILNFKTPIYVWLFSNDTLIKNIVDEVTNYETF